MRRGTSTWRDRYWKACEYVPMKVIDFSPGVRLAIDERAEWAFMEMARVFRANGYQVRPNVTGTYNCRKVTGGNYLSSHAYGIAIDVNADTNPFLSGRHRRLVTDIPTNVIQEIYAIRTRGGNQVWRWGGDWDSQPDTPHSNYDAMHFEIIVTPQELAEGVATAVRFDPRDSKTWPILKLGSRGEAVAFLQRWLGLPDDGMFGPITLKKVEWYQKMQGLVVDGIVGPATWTFILNDIVPKSERPDSPAPNKGMVGGLNA